MGTSQFDVSNLMSVERRMLMFDLRLPLLAYDPHDFGPTLQYFVINNHIL